LELNLTSFCPISEELGVNPVQVLPFLNFVRQSQSLRKVRFRTLDDEPGYLPYFLEAFFQNPLITDLEIETEEKIYKAPLEIGQLIQSKLNLKSLSVPIVEREHSFSEVLKANQTIETLCLYFRENTSNEGDRILRSISDHPRITRLELHGIYVTLGSEALHCMLASTTVLECLVMHFPIDDFFNDFSIGVYSYVERFVEALDANQSLTELHIPIYFFVEEAFESLLCPSCKRGMEWVLAASGP
jgi:hypothetical protein